MIPESHRTLDGPTVGEIKWMDTLAKLDLLYRAVDGRSLSMQQDEITQQVRDELIKIILHAPTKMNLFPTC